MKETLRRTDKEITEIYMRNRQTVYRVCYAYMKNPADTEDAVQDTFVQMIRKGPVFENEEHEKAWLIRTAENVCRNVLRYWWRRHEDIDDHYDLQSPDHSEADSLMQTVMALPDKYKTVVYLYYYEGYSSAEIAGMLGRPQSTIRNYMTEARRLLKERSGDDFDEER
ncbi:MAG: RNA polymerase sigma factor [Solobacterium sp.]|nr:RNA polymerase sigma factor [Solobacterium sp.]